MVTNGRPQPGCWGGEVEAGGHARVVDRRVSYRDWLRVSGGTWGPQQETLGAVEEGFLEAGLGRRVGGISAPEKGWEPHLRNMAAI